MSRNCTQNMNYYIHNTILSLIEYYFVYTLQNLSNKKRVDFSTLFQCNQ